MSAIDDMADVLAGFAYSPEDPARRRRTAATLVTSGVAPDDAEAVFSHKEATAGPEDNVSALVAALAHDIAKLKAGIEGVAKAKAKAAARAEKRRKPYPGGHQLEHPTHTDAELRDRPPTKLPDWASPQSKAAAAEKVSRETEVSDE